MVLRAQIKINKNVLSSESCLLGEKKRNEEAIRPQAVILLSSEPCAASKKVKLCSQPTVKERKIRLLTV